MRAFVWDRPDSRASARALADDEPVTLAADELLVVPVNDGDKVRIAGNGLQVGFGAGTSDLPDAVTWTDPPAVRDVRVLHVPTWGSVRALVVRSNDGRAHRVDVHLASTRYDPMAWYRADEAVWQWLDGPASAAPPLPVALEAMQPTVRELAALRSAWSEDAPSPRLRDWLQARWLAASLRLRPLARPHAVAVSLELRGGREVSALADEEAEIGVERRLVGAGNALDIHAGDADVVSLWMRFQAVGGGVVRLFEGDNLVREVRVIVPLRGYDEQRWTPPSYQRLVLPASKKARVEVLYGRVHLSTRAYRLRTSASDKVGLRSPDKLLTRASRPAPASAVISAQARIHSSGRAVPEAAQEERLIRALALAARDQTANSASALRRLADDESLPQRLRRVAQLEALGHQLADDAAPWQLRALLQALARQPTQTALPLMRAALEAFVRARPQALDPPAPRLQVPRAGHRDDREAVTLLAGALWPERNHGRARLGQRAERRAAREPATSSWTDLAASVWRIGSPWTNLAADQSAGVTTRMLPIQGARPGQRCAMRGAMGVRWLRLGPQPQSIDVEAFGTSHTRLALMVDPDVAAADAQVSIDGVVVNVHGGAGLSASAAVTPGVHQLRVARGPSVLLRAPSQATAECTRLRDAHRWVKVRDRATFPIAVGDVDTPVSLVVAAESITQRVELRLRSQGREQLAWLQSPASGALEWTVPAGADHVEVVTSKPVLVRLRARLNRLPAPRAAAPRPVAAAPSEEQLLARLRDATTRLRAAPSDAAAARQRIARANALERLGFSRLAAIDRERAGVHDQPWLPGVNVSIYAADLAPGSDAVVPLGELPRIALLPNPTSLDELASVLRAQERSATPAELIEHLRPSAERSTAVDALLLGELARRDGQLALASDTYERIGRAHRSGAALVEAAEQRLALALETQDRKHALHAYILARDAEPMGGDVDGLLARLTTAIDYDRVEPDTAAGSAELEQAWVEDEDASLGERVRRALVLAPAAAKLSRGRPIVIGLRRLHASALELDGLCHDFEGPLERCDLALELDGAPARCEQAEPEQDDEHDDDVAGQREPPPHDANVARPVHCKLAVGEDARRLTIRPPDREVAAWVTARALDESGAKPVTSLVRWTEIDRERPFRTLVVGPTVLRISVRTAPRRTEPLLLELEGREGETRKQALAVDPTPDANAARRRSGQRVSRAMVHYVTIADHTRYVATIRSGSDGALVRVAAARASGLPRPPTNVDEATSAPAVARAASAVATTFAMPTIGWDRASPWLTLGVRAAFVASDLTEGDDEQRDDFGELGVQLRRELWQRRLWLDADVFQRIRKGPISHGGSIHLSLASVDMLPGAYVDGRIVGQRLATQTGLGGFVTMGALSTLPLTTDWSLTPLVAFTLRRPDVAAAREPGVDRQVYSRYAETRPRSLDLVLRASQRPYVDMLTRYQGVTRLAPDFDGIDRINLEIRADLLAGGGWAPWARLDTIISYRPESPQRSHDFVRGVLAPRVVFWQWLASEGRLALEATASLSVDVPQVGSRAGAVAGGVALSYDHVFGRGMTDWSLAERPFRQRLEEGAAPVQRQRRGDPHTWSDADE